MQNPFKPCHLYSDRDSIKDIEDWIMLHPAENRIEMLAVMGMTWNTMVKMIDQSIEQGEFEDDE